MARDHILQGLIKAVDAIDETIRIIREAQTTEQAKDGLMARFELDDIQAKAILDMRLRALTGLEIEDLRAEFAAIEKRIRELEDDPGRRDEDPGHHQGRAGRGPAGLRR